MGRFRPGVKMTVAVVLLVPLTITLGFWQLHRAAEKRAIEAARLATYGTLPMDESHLDGGCVAVSTGRDSSWWTTRSAMAYRDTW